VLQAETRAAELLGLPLPQQDRFPSRGNEDLPLYGNLPGRHSEDQASRDAAREAGRWVNYTKMAAAVGVSVNTLRSSSQVLEDTFLGFRAPSPPPGSCSSTSMSGTSLRTSTGAGVDLVVQAGGESIPVEITRSERLVPSALPRICA
jgi:hypothetical protein